MSGGVNISVNGTTITTALTAGSNTIRVTSPTADGGPDLDYLEVR